MRVYPAIFLRSESEGLSCGVNSSKLLQELQESEKLQRLSTIKAGGVGLLLYGFMALFLFVCVGELETFMVLWPFMTPCKVRGMATNWKTGPQQTADEQMRGDAHKERACAHTHCTVHLRFISAPARLKSPSFHLLHDCEIMNYKIKPLIFILLTGAFFKIRYLIQTLQGKREKLLNVIKH